MRWGDVNAAAIGVPLGRVRSRPVEQARRCGLNGFSRGPSRLYALRHLFQQVGQATAAARFHQFAARTHLAHPGLDDGEAGRQARVSLDRAKALATRHGAPIRWSSVRADLSRTGAWGPTGRRPCRKAGPRGLGGAGPRRGPQGLGSGRAQPDDGAGGPRLAQRSARGRPRPRGRGTAPRGRPGPARQLHAAGAARAPGRREPRAAGGGDDARRTRRCSPRRTWR
jgi:hypothetical protein